MPRLASYALAPYALTVRALRAVPALPVSPLAPARQGSAARTASATNPGERP